MASSKKKKKSTTKQPAKRTTRARKPVVELKRPPARKRAAAAGRTLTSAQRKELRELGRDHERDPDEATAEPKVPGLVQRRGRLTANGERTPGRELRRFTVYLPPEMGERLEIRALRERTTISTLVETNLRPEYGS